MENRVSKLEVDVNDMKTRLAVAESNIKGIQEDITSIKDDTKWLRRTITNAIIVSFIGGLVAILFAAFKGGV